MADPTTASQLFLSFPTLTGVGGTVAGGRLVQAPGAHDVFRVTLSSADGVDALYSGAPAVVRWTSRVADGAFHGYVHRTDPVHTQKRRTASVTLVGVSWPLMQPGSRSWVGVRVSDVVRDIAFQFGLACDVEDHPLVLPQVMQAGGSYWQLLRELARETGYVLRMDGATLVFRSRQSLLAHFRPIAPRVEVGTFAPKIGAFNPELGATPARRAASGVDPYQAAIIADLGATDVMREAPPALSEQLLTGDVVHTQQDASTAVAAAQEANRFTHVASIVGWGNPLVAPERVIWPTPSPAGLGGHWVVRSVEHSFDLGRYSLRAEIGSDGLGDGVLRDGEPALRATTPEKTIVDPHRPGALPSWPYPKPVLRTSSPVVGAPGRAMETFSWVAPSTESRTS